SAVNALTLSPALCALLLKPHKTRENGKKLNFFKRFQNGFNVAFNATTERYGKSLTFFYKHKWVTPVIILAAAGGIWWSSSAVPTGFVPSEDRGIVFANIDLPVGSSIDATAEYNKKLEEALVKIPGVEDASVVA